MSEIKYIRAKDAIEGDFDCRIKIEVCHEIRDRIAIRFLTPTSFCGIGYYNWYFKDHFNNVFEFIN